MSLSSLLRLDCPLIVLDTETTGTKPKHDKIVQVGLIKIRPDGSQTEWSTYVNPECPIPPEATEVHGITDDRVSSAPTFRELASRFHLGFQKCDFAGYNVEFDVEMLDEEFRRVGMESPINGRVLDALDIFRDKHRRTLTDAVKTYLGESHSEAHDAMGDVRATLRVLERQFEAHPELPRDVGEIHRAYKERLDPHLTQRNGELVISFGSKHVYRSLGDVARDDPKFLRWILDKDFNRAVKDKVREALKEAGHKV